MMENLKYFQLNHLMGHHWASLILKCLVLLIIPNLDDNLFLRNMHYFVYMRELLKAYPKIPCLEVMKSVLNVNHLELIIETLQESRRNLNLDRSITFLMLTNS